MNKTIRNIITFPFEEPRFLVYVTSQKMTQEEIYALNLMEIKFISLNDTKLITTFRTQKSLNNIVSLDTSSIIKIKALSLNINGAMVIIIYFI